MYGQIIAGLPSSYATARACVQSTRRNLSDLRESNEWRLKIVKLTKKIVSQFVPSLHTFGSRIAMNKSACQNNAENVYDISKRQAISG
jgi:hypothetical protein